MRSTSARLHWVDHLRMLMILLVVNMHACVTYSHVGSWYYMVDPEPPMPIKIVFVLWQSHLQAFFMGLLFFLAGYFADRSLARRGPKAFLAERALRLGVPTLIYMLAIHPFILLALNPWHDRYPPVGQWYARYLLSGRFVGSSGPLWFAFALLIFCVILAGIRLPRSTSAPAAANGPMALTPAAIIGLGLGLGLATFLVRLAQPIGASVLNFQFCFFPQYIVAFSLGVAVSRRDALRSLAGAALARRTGSLALLGGPLLLIAVIVLGGPPPQQGANPYLGGWHWQALGLAVWEQVTGVALALGALGFCARYLNRDTPLLKWLSDRAFGVYVFHAPVLVALAMLFLPMRANALFMAALLTVVGLAASFIVTDLLRRIPGLQEVI